MSLRHVILGLALDQPISGYQVRRRLGTTMPGFWTVSSGQLYPTLASMAADGLLDVVVESTTGREYQTTATGEAEFRAWLRQDDCGCGDLREPFLLKLIFFDRLPRDRVLEHIQTQMRAVSARRDQLSARRGAYVPGLTAFQTSVLDLTLMVMECRFAFLERLETKVRTGCLTRADPLFDERLLVALRTIGAGSGAPGTPNC